MDWHTHVRICVADKRKWKINKQTNKCAIEEHLSFCGFQVAGAEQQENQLNNKMTIAIIYINLKAYLVNCPFIRIFYWTAMIFPPQKNPIESYVFWEPLTHSPEYVTIVD